MKDLSNLIMVLEILKQSYPFREQELSRIYNDACILVHSYGIEPEDGAYVIDGKRYELSEFAQKTIRKREKRESQPSVIEKIEKKENADTRVVTKEKQDNTPVPPPVATSTPAPMKTAKPIPQGKCSPILSRNIVTVISRENPNDIREYKFVVFPLSVQDFHNSTDIGLHVEAGEQTYDFVSSTNTGKVIRTKIDGVPFLVRGQWKERKFHVFIFLGDKDRYELKVEETKIQPEKISSEEFDQTFSQRIGDIHIFAMPHRTVNIKFSSNSMKKNDL